MYLIMKANLPCLQHMALSKVKIMYLLLSLPFFFVCDIFSHKKYTSMIEHHIEIQGNAVVLKSSNSLDKASKLTSDDLPSSSGKKLKLVNPDPMHHGATLVNQVPEADKSSEYELERFNSGSVHVKHDLDHIDCPQSVTGDKVERAAQDEQKDLTKLPLKKTCNSIGNSIKASCKWSNWKPLEKDLYRKGLEIFGRDRYVNLNSISAEPCLELNLIVSEIG